MRELPSENLSVLSVAMLTANFFPYTGGAEKQALELSKALVARGAGVTVLTRRLPGIPAKEEVEGVRVVRLPVAGTGVVDSISFMFSSFFYLVAHAGDYSVIHVHLASSPALAACAAGKLLGKRVVVKLGGGRGLGEISLSGKTFLGRLKLKLLAIFKPVILSVNSDLLDEMKESGLGSIPAVLFKNGVDTGRYTPVAYHEKIAAKNELGLPNRIQFLFVGRLVPEKRIKEFIETWAEVVREKEGNPEAGLLIVGKGPCETQLREAVKALDLDDSVIFAGEHANILPYYRAADIFVLPSISEGLSNAMLEAMSCGLAVMASRVGGTREAVQEGVNGLLFEPKDSQAIKTCMMKFIEDKNLAVRMGEKSRDMAVKNYSMARKIDELMEIYRQ
ncbi:MAG: glycosyltransferase family 4 protein [bacterium]